MDWAGPPERQRQSKKEELENMLTKSVGITFGIAALLLGLAFSMVVSSSPGIVSAATRLEARLAGPTLASGKARFEMRNDRVLFTTEVEDVEQADGTGSVRVLNGATEVLSAPLAIAGGFADLNLDTRLGDTVPSMAAGFSVEVRDGNGALILTGTLQPD